MDYSVYVALALGTVVGLLAIWRGERKRAPHSDR